MGYGENEHITKEHFRKQQTKILKHQSLPQKETSSYRVSYEDSLKIGWYIRIESKNNFKVPATEAAVLTSEAC
jgi:hypothetical protein